MISETETLIGPVLLRAVQGIGRPLRIEAAEDLGVGFFIFEERAGIYAKYSTNRMTPWNFTFTQDQIGRLLMLRARTVDIAVCLVCNRDGIVTATMDDMKVLIGALDEITATCTVAASRRPRHQYLVRGSAGELRHRVSEADFPRWVSKVVGGDCDGGK